MCQIKAYVAYCGDLSKNGSHGLIHLHICNGMHCFGRIKRCDLVRVGLPFVEGSVLLELGFEVSEVRLVSLLSVCLSDCRSVCSSQLLLQYNP